MNSSDSEGNSENDSDPAGDDDDGILSEPEEPIFTEEGLSRSKRQVRN